MKLLAIPVAAVLLLAGCTAATPDDGKLSIVASTDVYGSIATAIGGDLVDVTSIIDDPSQDPHSFEGSARVQLALSRADIVIENGGGYDDFVDTMLAGAGNPSATILNAADISGLDEHPASGQFNEHVWYDFDAMGKLADTLQARLASLDPSSADVFAANAATFHSGLDELSASVASLKQRVGGDGVLITEPVPLYLLTAAGFVNVTPPAFSEAVEEGTDVAPDVLAQTLKAIADGSAAILVYNEQTSGPETEAVLKAAKAAPIPVVGVTETLPDGVKDYLGWMQSVVDAISGSLVG
jgi:zinc/manganese transport system substrate-binding protein